VRITVDARSVASGTSGIVSYVVEIIANVREGDRGPHEPRLLVRQTASASGPDKSPDMQRTAELALEQIEDAAKEARAIMVLHGIIPAAPEPAPVTDTRAEWSALAERLVHLASLEMSGDPSDTVDFIRRQISELRERDRVVTR
jgi:hypothetical protein